MATARHHHLKRYRQIIAALVRNGFGLMLEQTGVFRYLRMRHRPLDAASAKAAEIARLSIGERLRRSCEELGPTFIKIGQILSTRPDVFSPEIAGELEKLQDAVNPFSFEEVRQVINEEFSESPDSVFAWIDPQPLAAASLSQVHQARLPTGQPVVIKVQRPGIKAGIQTDLEILQDLVTFICNHTQYGQLYDFVGMMSELEKTLNNELDFRKEAENAEQFRRNMSERTGVSVPTIRWIYSTERVLTMSHVEGLRISQHDQLQAAGINLTDLGIRLSREIICQILEDGFFHADPHPGNLSIQPDGEIVFLDLGMVGRLNDHRKKILSSLFVGMATQNSHQVVAAIVDLDTVQQRGGLRHFERDVERLMDQVLTMPIAEIQVGPLMAQVFQLAFQYHIQIPGEMTLIAKTLITLQGVIDKLDPNLNLLTIMEPMAGQLLRRSFSVEEIGRDLLRNLNDTKVLMQKAPSILLDMLQKYEDDDFNLRFELKDIQKVQKHFDQISTRLSFSVILLAVSIIVAGIIVGSSLSAGSDPEFNMILLRVSLIVAVTILFGLIISIIRTKRF